VDSIQKKTKQKINKKRKALKKVQIYLDGICDIHKNREKLVISVRVKIGHLMKL